MKVCTQHLKALIPTSAFKLLFLFLVNYGSKCYFQLVNVITNYGENTTAGLLS